MANLINDGHLLQLALCLVEQAGIFHGEHCLSRKDL